MYDHYPSFRGHPCHNHSITTRSYHQKREQRGRGLWAIALRRRRAGKKTGRAARRKGRPASNTQRRKKRAHAKLNPLLLSWSHSPSPTISSKFYIIRRLGKGECWSLGQHHSLFSGVMLSLSGGRMSQLPLWPKHLLHHAPVATNKASRTSSS